jgi:uncharacterized membrane protein YeaQ/YmgE (transglycosylase-associated protein family)
MAIGIALMQVQEQSQSFVVYVQTHGVIWWIVVGLLAGFLAGKLSRGRGFGCVTNVILGLVGAVVGGWVFGMLGITAGGFWASLAAATVGAILLVAVARLFAGGNGSE